MTDTPVSDPMLLARIAAGDETAVEELYRRYGGPCFGLAYRLLGDPQLAHDVVQQVFMTVWSKPGYDETRGAVSSWILTITHHKAVDSLRQEGNRRRRLAGERELLELAAHGPGPDDAAWTRIRAQQTRAALRQLSAEHREVLALAYYGGYTQREISNLTGLPLGTVKSRTLNAMRQLRNQLAENIEPGEASL
ncbi:MAG TPA: sigma-70 family RNA polymerase sigma factor [Mycobacteriales bacterium]|nr:sigma-70 family RNA polymerase sigma factor [Mycobacteriales bacterium]